MTIEEKINHDFVTGIVRFNETFHFFFMPPIYWVTDSDYYDPEYSEGNVSDKAFRGGVGKIDVSNANLYLSSINEDSIDANWIRENLAIHGENILPVFYVDIDNYVFVSRFYDLDYEEHVAPKWKGVYDNPLNYLPDNIKQIWR